MKKQRVTFLGPLGTYSHRATSEIFKGNCEEVPCSPFDEIFATIERDEADLAVIPLENNTAGIVDATLDLLIRSSLKIKAEYRLQIHHSLLSKENELSKIKKIYSLAQPYFQCQSFIQQNFPHHEWIQCSSSANSLQACLDNPNGSVAIAYADTGKAMGLDVLRKNIQDLSNNETRFVVLSKGVGFETDFRKLEASRTTVVFTLEDKPGTLLQILNIFHKYNLNLCQIESRPTRLKEWRYYFCLTVENIGNANNLDQALTEIRNLTPWIKEMGSYPILQS